MLPQEFMRKKNKILRMYLDIDFDLIPESQIQWCEPRTLSNKYPNSSCPYCQVYLDDECKGCPMAEAENTCEIDEGSTFERYKDEISEPAHWFRNSPAYEPMSLLIEQYNKEYWRGYEEHNKTS